MTPTSRSTISSTLNTFRIRCQHGRPSRIACHPRFAMKWSASLSCLKRINPPNGNSANRNSAHTNLRTPNPASEELLTVTPKELPRPVQTHHFSKTVEQFALPCAREGRISLVKILFATRQNLQTNSKDALVASN